MAATDTLSAPPQPSSATDWLKQQGGMLEQQEAEAQKEKQEMAPGLSSTQQQMDQPRPSPPGLQAAPDQPKSGLNEDVSGWMAAASVMAAIAGASTRQHVTAALRAFGGFGQGFSKGQLAKADDAYKQWKAANDSVIENNQSVMEEYHEALADRKLGIDEQMQQIQLIAISHKDAIMADAAQARNITLVGNLLERQDKAQADLQQKYDSLSNKWDQFKDTFEAKYGSFATFDQNNEAAGKMFNQLYPVVDQKSGARQGVPPGTDPAKFYQDWFQNQWPKMKESMGGGGASGALDDKSIDMLADQRIAGDKSALTGMGYGAIAQQNKAKLQQAIQKKLSEQGLTGGDLAAKTAEFMGTQAGERTLGTRSANIGMGIAEMQKFVPMAVQLSNQVDRTQFPTMNAAMQAANKGTGGEAIVRFIAANNAIINAYSQIVTRGGQPTDMARGLAQEVLSTAYSKGQYAAAADQLMKEAAAAQQAPGAVRGEMRGAVTGQPQPTTAAPTGGGSQADPLGIR